MHKVLRIAVREYKAAVRTKSFMVTLLILPVLMLGSVVVQLLSKQHSDIKDKRFAIVDRTPRAALFSALAEAAALRNEQTHDPETGEKKKPEFLLEQVRPSEFTDEAIRNQRLQLSERVRHGELWGFVEIGPDVFEPPPPGTPPPRFEEASDKLADFFGKETAAPTAQRSYLRYQTDHPTYQDFPHWMERTINGVIQLRRWARAGLAPATMQAMLQPVVLRQEGLSQRINGEIADPPLIHVLARLLVPVVLVVLMFMVVMIGSTPAMQGVVEEKMQRIAEVLLGSVRPFELMLGKLLGSMGVSLTIAGIYLGGMYWAAQHYGFAEFLPPDILVWFVVYQALAVLMYGSLFLAIGAAATDIKETQTLVMPVILLCCIPMFLLSVALEDPNNALVVGISFFPPVTPMMMIARQAVPPGIPWWQPTLAIVLVLAVTVGCVYAAGRIFRVGILMQGKGARLGQMMQWVFRG
jgi:ABC-2 type transport system permease protein